MAADTVLRDRDEVGSEGGGRDEKQIVRLLIGSRMLRRRRIRNLLLAHLLREGREREDEDGDEGGSEERRLVRLLVAGGAIRRRRVRRLLLALLLPIRTFSVRRRQRLPSSSRRTATRRISRASGTR